MPKVTDAYDACNKHVAMMQKIIDEHEDKHEFSYVNTPEWKTIEEKKRELQKAYTQAWNEEHNKKAIEATGLNIGDNVYYLAPSWLYGGVIHHGIVVLYRGILKVKANQTIEGKRYFQVNKGWKKEEKE